MSDRGLGGLLCERLSCSFSLLTFSLKGELAGSFSAPDCAFVSWSSFALWRTVDGVAFSIVSDLSDNGDAIVLQLIASDL